MSFKVRVLTYSYTGCPVMFKVCDFPRLPSMGDGVWNGDVKLGAITCCNYDVLGGYEYVMSAELDCICDIDEATRKRFDDAGFKRLEPLEAK